MCPLRVSQRHATSLEHRESERVTGAVLIFWFIENAGATMPLQPPTLNTGRRGLLLLGLALGLALLFLFWRWLPVSIAVPPSSARTAGDMEGIASGLTAPPGYRVDA